MFLILGAVVNVGVAWGCAVLVNPFEVERYHAVGESVASGMWWDVTVRSRYGVRRWYSWHAIAQDSEAFRAGPFPGEALPDWSPFALKETDYIPAQATPHRWTAQATGWPALSFCWDSQDDVRWPAARFRLGIVTPLPWWLDDGNPGQPRVIPFGPLWSGLVINTLTFATILWLPFASFAARRLVRKRRGRCVRCGYDLCATPACDPCPECGANMSATRAA